MLPPTFAILAHDQAFFECLAGHFQRELGWKTLLPHDDKCHQADFLMVQGQGHVVPEHLQRVTRIGIDVGGKEEKNYAMTFSCPFPLSHLLNAAQKIWDSPETEEVTWIIPEICGLDMRAKVLVDGMRKKCVELTDKEILLLQALYEENDEPLTREALLQEVWGYDETIDTHTLETHIYRLRQKLKEACGRDDMIRSNDKGYMMAVGKTK